jgi:hypothetical protein
LVEKTVLGKAKDSQVVEVVMLILEVAPKVELVLVRAQVKAKVEIDKARVGVSCG